MSPNRRIVLNIAATDDRPPSARGRNVFRDGEVFKVTHPDDVEIAELMLLGRENRHGQT